MGVDLLTEEIAAAHLVGPVLYQYLFAGARLSQTDVERITDAFLAAFSVS